MTITKIGRNQYQRPSGVIASKDDKYFYWQCSVSAIMTFANAIRFKKLLEVYKSEKNLVKSFVCREAKKYLAEGYTEAEIRQMVIDHKGDLPKLNPSVKKDPRIPKKERKVRNKAVSTEKIVENVNGVETEVVKKTYAWSDNPTNYFIDGPAVFDVAESSVGACLYPNRYLDDECRDCPIYDKCACALKFTEEDWKKGAKKFAAPIVKKIESFDKDEVVA